MHREKRVTSNGVWSEGGSEQLSTEPSKQQPESDGDGERWRDGVRDGGLWSVFGQSESV